MAGSPPPMVIVDVSGRTDPGLARATNEDWLVVGNLDGGSLLDRDTVHHFEIESRGPLLVVCDGMGGAAAGEIASQLAANTIWNQMKISRQTDERPVFARQMRRAIRAANKMVLDTAKGTPELKGMGTTVSAVGFVGNVAIIAQVGDSRVYIARGETLTQVTRDQSVVSALIQAGRLSEAEAKQSARRNQILQALGTFADIDVAISIAELRRGDRVLVCSDGLSTPVSDEEIQSILVRDIPVQEAIDALFELAHLAGAPDNITVALARFSGEGLSLPIDELDQPQFTEFDPREEGENALTTTSRVGRRLARRAGLRNDTMPPSFPATSQHTVPSMPAQMGEEAQISSPDGPAELAFKRGKRLSLLAWGLAALVAAVLVGLLFFWA